MSSHTSCALQECVLKPEALLDFAVEYVVPNEIGSHVALVGAHGCCVVSLSCRVRADLNKQANAVVTCKVVALGHLFLGTHPEVSIVKARWHPASLSHLGLLGSDGALRLYNVLSADVEDPEQLLRVTVESLRVLSFDFGSSLDWTHFTVFYALSDGNIYAQCPVVPFGCRIPEELISALESRQKTEIERLDGKLVKLQKNAALPDQQKRLRRTVKRAAAAGRALKWAGSLRLAKTSQVTSVGDVPLLQGPLTVALSDADVLPEDERVCDMVVTGSLFPVIVTAFESGLIEMRLQLSSVLPVWPEKGAASGAASGRLEALVLFDRLDVAPCVIKGVGSATLPKEHPLPLLHSDPLHANVWYLSHAGGVECLALPDLDDRLAQLAAAVKSGAVAGTSLPRAEIASLLQRDLCSPGTRLRSLAVVATASGEYFMAYDCEGAASLSSVDLLGSVAPVAAATASRDLTAPSPVLDQSEMLREGAWVRELRELDKRRPKQIPHVETLSSGRLTRLEQMSSATELADLYKRHAAFLTEGTAILNAGSDDIVARKDAVNKLARRAQEKLASFTARTDQLSSYVETVKRNERNLRERVAILSGVLTDLQPNLSDAERAYFAMLKTKEKELASMDSNVDGLQKFLDTHPAIFEKKESRVVDADLLDEQRMLVMQENLDRQNETIAQLVATVRALQNKAANLNL